jgi:hypothetical protein
METSARLPEGPKSLCFDKLNMRISAAISVVPALSLSKPVLSDAAGGVEGGEGGP